MEEPDMQIGVRAEEPPEKDPRILLVDQTEEPDKKAHK